LRTDGNAVIRVILPERVPKRALSRGISVFAAIAIVFVSGSLQFSPIIPFEPVIGYRVEIPGKPPESLVVLARIRNDFFPIVGLYRNSQDLQGLAILTRTDKNQLSLDQAISGVSS
jgi:hypothetical protein